MKRSLKYSLCSNALRKTDPTVFDPVLQGLQMKRRLLKSGTADRKQPFESLFKQQSFRVWSGSLNQPSSSKRGCSPASAPSRFKIQTVLVPVMMRNCITPIFSQEYCFSEKLGLPDSVTADTVYSVSADLFTILPMRD